MMTSAISSQIVLFFEWWSRSFGPFLLWWVVGSGIVVLLAETVYQLVSKRQAAFRAFLWRLAVVAIVLLPPAYLFISPFVTYLMNCIMVSILSLINEVLDH